MVHERELEDTLGIIVHSKRVDMGLSQDILAERIGLSKRYIASIENEKKKPSFKALYKIVRTLGVDANKIFYPENSAIDTQANHASRLLSQCEEHEIKAVTALIETLLSEKKQASKL